MRGCGHRGQCARDPGIEGQCARHTVRGIRRQQYSSSPSARSVHYHRQVQRSSSAVFVIVKCNSRRHHCIRLQYTTLGGGRLKASRDRGF